MKYDPKIHHRKSIRLQGYDYSQAGLYFVTICTQNRLHLFGEITDGAMVLNDAGVMVEKWYYELENKYPDKKCHEIIIMPNHCHFIIENATGAHVGADLCVCPDDTGNDKSGGNKKGAHIGAPLPRVVQWIKTMTTNEYMRGVKTNGWAPFDKKMWQRNYWEHIIRDANEYNRIAQYILDNPKKWTMDKLNADTGNRVMESPAMYNQEAWMI